MSCFAVSGQVLIGLAVAIVESEIAFAQKDAQAQESMATAVPSQRASGVVFDDRNGDQVRDPDEPGVPGIRVSNGAEIVTTDADGRYSIAVDDDEILFVIKPRGWAPPLDRNNLPQFYFIHKPAGSPPDFRYPGVAKTGPLPESIDFPLTAQAEPDNFRALMFGDTQSRNVTEVEYMTHDVIEQVVADQAHGASFGVTLGDIVFDDLDVMNPHNEAIALIGIPWYNVIGNHDLNYDAATDELSDETFERHYGPAYYSFDYGPTHFLVLDDVNWVAADGDRRAHYHGGLGARQMEFIRNDLAAIPAEQLVVLMMHIPLINVDDRHELYRLIEQRPAAVSIAAHTHYMEHRFIGEEDGWRGPQPHHHIINVTVCGSWWRGKRDERGIPHATMSDGGPNGYSVMEFDGANYSLEFHPAGRPANYQMRIEAPEVVTPTELAKTVVLANVFAGSDLTECKLRVGRDGEWRAMEQISLPDPAFLREKAAEEQLENRDWIDLPSAHVTPHIWRAMLPPDLGVGTHAIEIRATSPLNGEHRAHRVIRVEADSR